MKEKLVAALICMLLVSLVPIGAGMSVEKEPEPEPEDGVFGITIIRGFVSNVKQQGTSITFRAIRLHYLSFSTMEKITGVVRLQKCTIDDFAFERRWDMGPLGSFSWIFGIIRGDLEIG